MDKYQDYILHTLQKRIDTIYAYADSNLINLKEGLFDDQLNKTEIAEKIVIKQNDDITITKYHFFLIHDAVEAVYAKQKNKCFAFESIQLDYHLTRDRSGAREKVDKNKKTFYYELDFDNKIDYIKIVFKDNVADELVIPIEFIDADKEAYYAKKEAERIAKLRYKAAISYATGINLVNIYFQPCSEKYAKTEIILYRDKFMMAKYTVEGELYFKAITELAFNNYYSFVLKQLSANDEILLETEHINFKIKLPSATIQEDIINW